MAVLETRFTRSYGVELPIISAGMAFVATAPLAAAVSAAGGFGTLGASAMPVPFLKAQIEAIRDRTDRPFGVNFIPRFETAEHIALCAAEHVSSVTFFWDSPDPKWLATLKEAGVRIWVQVGSPDQARSAVAAGADAVIAQGFEAGGHNLAVASAMALIPTIVDAVAPVPVYAAGGIADGRGLVAALALGAEAAVMGTRFVASTEADANPGYQQQIVGATVDATRRHGIFGFDFPDATVRGLRNRVVREWEGKDDPPPYAGKDPAHEPFIGSTKLFGKEMPLTRFMGLPPTRATQGDLEQMSLLAGESAALVKNVMPVAEMMARIRAEASAAVRRLS